MKQSIENLRSEIDRLAVIVGYDSNTKLNEENEKFVWDLLDFGYPEDNVLESKCSLQATLDFDSKKWEMAMIKDHRRLRMLEIINCSV